MVMRRHLVLRFSQGMDWEVSHIRVCRFSREGKAFGGVATFAGVGCGIVDHLLALTVLMST